MDPKKDCLPCNKQIDPAFLAKLREERLLHSSPSTKTDEELVAEILEKNQPRFSQTPSPASSRGIYLEAGQNDTNVTIHTPHGPQPYRVIHKEGNQLIVRYDGEVQRPSSFAKPDRPAGLQ